MATILIVDSDRDTVRLVGTALRSEGHTCSCAADPGDAVTMTVNLSPDLVLLSTDVDDDPNFAILEEVRRLTSAPVIVMSDETMEDQVLRAFRLGASDYVAKPFSLRVLLARVQAQLRRAGQLRESPEQILRVGPLEMDVERHLVRLHDQDIRLSPTEFRLLHMLMWYANVTLSCEFLLRQVWGGQDYIDPDVVRVAIHRLRKKLGATGPEGPVLVAVSGAGYRLESVEPLLAGVAPGETGHSR
jgi:DNA-binding response OmpR family regulator